MSPKNIKNKHVTITNLSDTKGQNIEIFINLFMSMVDQDRHITKWNHSKFHSTYLTQYIYLI